jgi:hypothetical protein
MRAHDFFKKCSLPLLPRQSGTVILCGASDDLSDLRIRWESGSEVLPLMFGIKDIPHTQDLPVSLELGGDFGLGQFKPVRTGVVLKEDG